MPDRPPDSFREEAARRRADQADATLPRAFASELRTGGPVVAGMHPTAAALNAAISSRAAADHGHSITLEQTEAPRIVYAVYWLTAITLALIITGLTGTLAWIAWVGLTGGLTR